MRIKTIEIRKNMKVGLPNYSSIDVACGLTAEVGENEDIDWGILWDKINQQLFIQEGSIDPNWIITKEYQNFFKTIIKSKKEA